MSKLRFGILGLALSIGLGHLVYSQDQSKVQNFYELRNSLQQEFEIKAAKNGGSYKGIGYTGFKRWESFWGPRLYPGGSYDNMEQAIEQLRTSLASPSNKARTGCDPNTTKWQPLGPNDHPNGNRSSGVGRIITMEYDPVNPNIMYAGTMTSGLWKSEDAGENWYNLNTDFMPFIGVAAIAINPQNTNEIYIGTGTDVGHESADYTNSIGIYKTTDGGETWSPVLDKNNNDASTTYDDNVFKMGVGANVHINRVLINPNNPNIILAAANWWVSWESNTDNWGALYRSINGGQTWTIVKRGYFYDAEFAPGNPNIVYASGKEVFKSTNAGASWTKININGFDISGNVGAASRALLAVSEDYSGRVYVCASKAGVFQGIWSSNDYGNSFLQKASNNAGTEVGSFHFGFGVSPHNRNEVWVGTNKWLGRSYDGGENFSLECLYGCSGGSGIYSSVLHMDINSINHHPTIPGKIYLGNDAGVMLSTTGGTPNSWVPKCKGLEITMLYKFGLSRTDPVQIVTGLQDDTQMHFDGNGNWKQLPSASGDGMECIIDYTNPDIVYVESQNGSIRRYNNTTSTPTYITPSGAQTGNWVTPYIMHPTNPQILYAGYETLYKTTDRGNSWTAGYNFNGTPFNLSSSTRLLVIRAAPSDPDNTIIVSMDQAEFTEPGAWGSSTNKTTKMLFKTTDGGTSWTDITPQIPGNIKMITDILIDKDDANKMWVSYSGFLDNNYSSNKVYYSDNGGSTWSAFGTGMPGIPVNSIIQDPIKGGKFLYAGTDNGVYYTTFDGSNYHWERMGVDLPYTIVREVEISKETRRIYAATYGRSVWYAKLPTDFDATNYSVTSNQTWTPANNPIKAGTKLLYIDGELRIKANKQLTLDGVEIEFGPNTNLILENGATLNVNGSSISELEYCYGSWDLEVGVGARMNINAQSLVHMNDGSIVNDNGSIYIAANGHMELHENAQFWVKSGGLLQLEDNSLISMHHGSLLHVRSAGTLNYNNATSTKGLRVGSNTIPYQTAEFRVEGTVNIGANANFSNNGDGFISVNGSGVFNFGTGSTFKLEGRSQNDEVLRLGNNVRLQIDAASSEIVSSKINFGSGAAIDFNKRRAVSKNYYQLLTIENSKFLPYQGHTNLNNEITGFAMDEVTILNSTFNNLGFAMKLTVQTGDVTVENSQFNNCTRGVFIDGGGVDAFVNNTFFYKVTETAIDVKNIGNLYLDQSVVEDSKIGIKGRYSNVFLTGKSIIQLCNVGVDMTGNASNYDLFTMGGKGTCAWLVYNSLGLRGRNVYPNIDAVTHSNKGEVPIAPNRFDHNTRVASLCLEGSHPRAIMARGNYWGNADVANDFIAWWGCSPLIIEPVENPHRIDDVITNPNGGGGNKPKIIDPAPIFVIYKMEECAGQPSSCSCPDGGNNGAGTFIAANEDSEDDVDPAVIEKTDGYSYGYNSYTSLDYGAAYDQLSPIAVIPYDQIIPAIPQNLEHEIKVSRILTRTIGNYHIDIKPGSREGEIEVFPNPTSDGIISVVLKGRQFNSLESKSLRLDIVNVYGNVVVSENVKSNNIELNLSNHAKGIYYLRLIDGETILSEKVVYQ